MISIKRVSFITLFMSFILVFLTSCSSNSEKKILDNFFRDFKNKSFEDSYNYLLDNELKQNFSDYINILSKGESEDADKLNDVILDKITNVNYEIIGDINDNEDGSKEANIKISYYNISEGYENALEEFLSKSLDFNNLDELYNVDNIISIFVKHINKLKASTKDIKVSFSKDNRDLKIVLDEEFLNILVGDSVNILENFKSMILEN